MKKILPNAITPITSFPGYANTLSILMAYPKAHDWVYSHYIHINTIKCENKSTGKPEIEYLFFVDSDWDKISTTWSGELLFGSYLCPFLRCYSIPSELLLNHITDFSSFVKEAVERNMYVKAFIDVSEIEAYKPGFPGFAHDIFIYGYDDGQVLFADFLIKHDNKYSNDYATFSEIDLGYRTLAFKEAITEKKDHSVVLIKVDEDMEAPADMNFVRASVSKYLLPSEVNCENLYNHFARLGQSLTHKPIKAYEGVDVYNYLTNYIHEMQTFGESNIDIRLFHSMYDHKKMMLDRMEYFLHRGLISDKKSPLIDSYKAVLNCAQAARNKVMKSNLTNKINTLHSYVFDKYEEAKSIEMEILTKFFLEK